MNKPAFDTGHLLLSDVFLPDAFAKINVQAHSECVEYREPANLISYSDMLVREAQLVSVMYLFNVLRN